MTESNSNLIFSGNGSPEGVVTAPVDSVYSDLENAEVYYKTSGDGNTGWELIVSLVSLVYRGLDEPPEGIQVAPVGSIYVNPRTATVYRKMSKEGAETWETLYTLDNNVIAENIAELLTNSVNMTSVFYDIFLNPQPMDVVLWQYNDNNTLVPVSIPNRAKDRKIAKEGTGTPEGYVEAPVGTAYVDTQNSVVYFKVSGNDQYGWSSVLNREDALSIIRTYCVNRGFINIDSVRTYLINNEYVTTEQVASGDIYGVVKLDGSSITSNGNGAIQASGIVNTNTTDTSPTKKIWTGQESTFETLTPDVNTIYILEDSGKVFIGKNEVTSMAFPSSNFNDSFSLTTANTHAQYVMPANGWFHFRKSSSASGQYLQITKGNGQMFATYASAASQSLTLNVPVLKGEEIDVYYTAAASATSSDKFGLYVGEAIVLSDE